MTEPKENMEQTTQREPVKVYELAKELGMDSLSLLDKLGGLGIKVKNHMSELSDSDVEAAKAGLATKPAAAAKASGKSTARAATTKSATKATLTKTATAKTTAKTAETTASPATAKTGAVKTRRKAEAPAVAATEVPEIGRAHV